MVFRRRKPLSLTRRLRGLFWPESGWGRAWSYLVMRLKRLPGTPHSIAAGFACGAAVSFTPFVGLHFVLSFLVSFLVRGNYVAAAVGTVVGNPWTFPFIWAWIFGLGQAMLGHGLTLRLPLEYLAWDHLLSNAATLFWPMLVGSIPTVIVVWIAFYVPLVRFVTAFQQRRRLARRRRRGLAVGMKQSPVE